MVTESWGRCQFWTDRTVWTNLDFKPTSKPILGDCPREFCNLSNVGRTLNSDLERRNYDRLKLNDIIRYDFHFELISSFFQIFLTFIRLKDFQSSSYSCTCICIIMSYVGPIRSSPKEKIYQIYMAYA
jgi:hypothetical protein